MEPGEESQKGLRFLPLNILFPFPLTDYTLINNTYA
jgi:hypothetical protein